MRVYHLAGTALLGALLLATDPALADGGGGVQTRRDNPNGTNLEALECSGFGRLPDLQFTGTSPYRVDDAASPWFAGWFRCAEAKDPWFMSHWVDCAYATGTTITGESHEWRGRLGLAGVPPGRKMTEPARRWVSACLLASYNRQGRRMDTSLRGASPGLPSTPGERWTMGHPEGVFFGDLFAKGGHGSKTAFAMSLNVPDSWDKSWLPPSVVLGRTLDSALIDEDGDDIASYLGTCGRNRAAFRWPAGTPPGAWSDEVTVAGKTYPPVFVLGPHFANFEAADGSPNPSARWSVIDRAGKSVKTNPCLVGECIGAYGQMAAASTGDACHYDPQGATADARGLRSATLRAGQEVEVVLRMIGDDPDDAASERYSALIRYRHGAGPAPEIRVLKGPDADPEVPASWIDATLDWGSGGGWEWLHVYPMVPTEKNAASRPTLRFRLFARVDTTVELDAAGFVPGEPWCCRFPVRNRPRSCQTPSRGVTCGSVQPPLR